MQTAMRNIRSYRSRLHYSPDRGEEIISITVETFEKSRPLFHRVPLILVTRPTLDFIELDDQAELQVEQPSRMVKKAIITSSRKYLEPNQTYSPATSVAKNVLWSSKLAYCEICRKYVVVTVENKKKLKMNQRIYKRLMSCGLW